MSGVTDALGILTHDRQHAEHAMGKHFHEDVAFPLIADAITSVCEDGSCGWADRDQIVVWLMDVDENRRLIKTPSEYWSVQRLYENVVDWWSAYWTVQADTIAPYRESFEQGRVSYPSIEGGRHREIWAYRPVRR